jgi:serine/threonine protein kinase
MDKATLKETERDPLIETRFGGYAILEHLGKGGMGDVYKALQVGLDRVVALKILPSLLARSKEFSERFFSEAYAISRLQHHNIVTIYDYGEEGGQKYIAMQYIQGTTLSKLIHEEKKLDYQRIIGITKQICRGLKYAHQNEIVHRDIKSGNIMVEAGDKVYISDFGIAKVIAAPGITTTGMAMGTPEYMAPEQCEGGIVDGQSDIYGLGVILFEMVTGKPPFLADTPLAVAYKQVHETPPLLGKKCPDVPPRLELIVAKCLKKSKDERYKTADELLIDLDSAHLDLNPGYEAEKALPPSDLRITDRREKDRRGQPVGISRGYLGGTLALFAVILGALAYLYLHAGGRTDGLRWIRPMTAENNGDLLNPGNAQVTLLFDGDSKTSWSAPEGASETEIRLGFAKKVLLTGMTIEAGLSGATGPSANVPKAVILEIEGRKPQRFNLSDTDAPQYFALGGALADKARLRFVAGANGAAAANGSAPATVTVREVRFLGLPYD